MRTGVVRLNVRVCARALCTVRIHRRVGAQVAGRSQRDILSASCTQEVTVPRDSRCTARQRKVCRATRRAPRCTCTADQAERVDEMSHRSAVQVDALHACCDGGMMAPPPHAAAAPYVLGVPRAGPQTHPSEWCSQRHVWLDCSKLGHDLKMPSTSSGADWRALSSNAKLHARIAKPRP